MIIKWKTCFVRTNIKKAEKKWKNKKYKQHAYLTYSQTRIEVQRSELQIKDCDTLTEIFASFLSLLLWLLAFCIHTISKTFSPWSSLSPAGLLFFIFDFSSFCRPFGSRWVNWHYVQYFLNFFFVFCLWFF